MIGARETVRVRYTKGNPEVEASPKERTPRTSRERSAGSRLVDARRQDRERRHVSIRRRRVGIALGVVVLLIASAFGVLQLRDARTFAVTNVRVSGASAVASGTVARLAAIPADATLLNLDTDAVAGRLETDPWVASATVQRDFPHTVVITLRERTPAVWANISRRVRWLVSSDGYWLRPRSRNDTLVVPVVTDVEGLVPEVGKAVGSPEVTNVLAVLRGLGPQLRELVTYASAPSVEKTALVTRTGIQIFVGPATDMKKKDAVVRAILAQQKGKLVYINVRTPDRPTWRGLEQP